MLQLRRIEETGLDKAAEILAKGFPRHDRRFWDRGVACVMAHCRRQGIASVGSLLVARERPVGVLLEIPSRHVLTGEPLINLSSWYVEPKYRWFAPRMLMQAIAAAGITYTDLTPSTEVIELNTKLGFKTIDGSFLLVATPLAAVTGRSLGAISAIDDLPIGALPDHQVHAIRVHQRLGCTALAVKIADGYHPLVLDIVRRRGVPVARVLYAEGSSVVTDALKPLASFLVKRGIPLLRYFVRTGSDAGFPLARRTRHQYQVKGLWQDAAINELFSERVFLSV